MSGEAAPGRGSSGLARRLARRVPRHNRRGGLAGGVLLLPLLACGGCSAVSDVAGLAAGGAAGGATANPAVGFAVGVSVRAGVEELQKYVSRRRHRGEQDAIATAAGSIPVGSTQAWEIKHTIPIGNRRGELLVADEYTTPLTTCRNVVFSVVDGGERALFTTTLCRQGTGAEERWKWAAAEPAVDRWGYLQVR